MDNNKGILARPPVKEAHLDLRYVLNEQGQDPTGAKSEFEFHPCSDHESWRAGAIIIQENLEFEDNYIVEAFQVSGDGHYLEAVISIPSATRYRSVGFSTFASAVRFARFAWSVWHSGGNYGFREAGMEQQHRH